MDSISKRLHELAIKQRLPHGLLFSGFNLSSMRSHALGLVQRILCETTQNLEGCGTCSACRKIQSGHHPDLYTLKAESREIQVEQVRSLQRWIYIQPHQAQRKVTLIEEAHRLNASSANALLKVLEEPPLYATIILLARATAPLLPTIKSRLMTISFCSSVDMESQPQTPKPEWTEDLNQLLGKKPFSSTKEIFQLTEVISKDRENLPWFFWLVQKYLRDDLLKAHEQTKSSIIIEEIESLFDLALRTEQETVQRYSNVALNLDHFLLKYVAPIQ